MRTLANRYVRTNVTAKEINKAVLTFDADSIFNANQAIEEYKPFTAETLKDSGLSDNIINGISEYLKKVKSEAVKVVVKYNEETDRNSAKVLLKSGFSQNCRLWGVKNTTIAAQDIDANKAVFHVCLSGGNLVTDTMTVGGVVREIPRLYADISAVV